MRAVAVAAVALLGLAGCGGDPPGVPANVTLAAPRAAALPTPPARTLADTAQIVAARFSALDVPLGTTWRGDVVVSTNVSHVALRTNLFDVAARRVAAGRFRFAVRVYDLPAFLVRPYALKIVASTAAGRETTLVVPFRIVGRTAATLAPQRG